MKKEYVVELREEEADEFMDDHWVGELVRCKDCKYWHDPLRCQLDSEGLKTPGDWFCADGERS